MKLGDKVKFTHVFYRTYDIKDRTFCTRIWGQRDSAGTGIFLGNRTLKNGKSMRSEYGHPFFETTEYVKACLICRSSRENPIYVPRECIEVVK